MKKSLTLARYLNNRKAIIGLAILIVFIGMALIGPLLVQDPHAYLSAPLQPPNAKFFLGTSGQGQDVLAQTVAGTRISLLSALVIGVSTTVIGALLGLAAAYWRGWIDEMISLFTNVFLVIPGLPLAIVVAAYLPSGATTIAFVLIATGWAWNARVFRAQALSLRQRDFVSAALVSGESTWRILVYEILPNMASLLVSTLLSSLIYAIGAQVGLEFLGLGDISQVTWGTNLYWASNDGALLTNSWWTFVPTGLCIALVGFALALMNFAIDEITNPVLVAEKRWRKQLNPSEKDVGMTPLRRENLKP